MKNVTILAALGALAVSGSLLVPTVAEASTISLGREDVSQRIFYGDLNLASEAGQATLKRRVAASVSQICADQGLRGVRADMAERECIAQASDTAADLVELAIADFAKARRA